MSDALVFGGSGQIGVPVLTLSAARAMGRMQGLGDAAVARMREDLVFDVEPAQRDLGYAPRAFAPAKEMFGP